MKKALDLEYGLVFAGGGARGSYEYGVWKALNELGIKITAVAGTSIGALNGALYVQDAYDIAGDIWLNAKLSDVVNIAHDTTAPLTGKPSKKAPFANWLVTARLAIANGLLDSSPMKQTLYRVIDEDKIRKSPIDFGIVTMSLTDVAPIEIFKEDIPQGQLADYLIASAAFPAFGAHIINDKKFLDGGLYNNIPVNLIMKKGIKNIIVVDICGVGLNRRFDTSNCNIISIVNSEDLGPVLEISKERIKRNIDIGYYDTMKIFKKNIGKIYFLRPTKIKKVDDYYEMANEFLGYDIISRGTKQYNLVTSHYIKLIKEATEGEDTQTGIYIALLEATATELGIDRECEYTVNDLLTIVTDKYEKMLTDPEFLTFATDLHQKTASPNKIDFNKKLKNTMEYTKFLACFDSDTINNKKMIYKLRRLMALAAPRVFLANFFLFSIRKQNKTNS